MEKEWAPKTSNRLQIWALFEHDHGQNFLPSIPHGVLSSVYLRICDKCVYRETWASHLCGWGDDSEHRISTAFHLSHFRAILAWKFEMGGLTTISLIGDMSKWVGAHNVKLMTHLGRFDLQRFQCKISNRWAHVTPASPPNVILYNLGWYQIFMKIILLEF